MLCLRSEVKKKAGGPPGSSVLLPERMAGREGNHMGLSFSANSPGSKPLFW